MKVKRKRRRFSREFKLSAVEAMAERSHEELAAELGVHPSLLYKWRAALEEESAPEAAFPGQGNRSPHDDELARLRAEVAQLKQERDFLRKAAAYFAKE